MQYDPTPVLDELMVYSKSLELKESKYEASWMEDTIRSIYALSFGERLIIIVNSRGLISVTHVLRF